jgi:anaerobic magnesium-protoporphyrin IX monomethyl ester cyclase
MSNNVVLVSPRSRIVGARPYYPQYSESLGIGYIASSLEANGFNPTILDMEARSLSEEEVIAQTKLKCPINVGIAALSKSTMDSALGLAKLVKEATGAHVTLGGHLATFSHEDILRTAPQVDSVVRGEAELTLPELVRGIQRGSLEGINGITYRGENGIVVNANRPRLDDLDSLPFPKRYNLQEIIDAKQRVSVLSSRGCYGGCSFCTLASFNKGWRPRKVDDVLDEIEELESQGVRKLRFNDENFFGHCEEGLERAYEFSEKLRQRGLKVSYKMLCRADDINEDILKKLISTGLEKISVGIESFNQRQLDLYNKKLTPEKIEAVTTMIKNSGLSANFSFIMFDPFVTLDEVSNNLGYMERNSQFFEYRRLLTKLRAEKGTVLERLLEREGLLEGGDEFGSDIRFVYQETEKLWEYVESRMEDYKSVDNLLTEVKDNRLKRVADNSRRGIKETLTDISLKKIRDVEREMYDTWMGILKRGITSIKSYKQPEISKVHAQRFEGIERKLYQINHVLIGEDN